MSEKEHIKNLTEAFAKDDFVVKKVAYSKEDAQDRRDSSIGIRAEHKWLKNGVTGKKKAVFYVEGTPFEMGELMGQLAEDDIKRMTTEYIKNIPALYLKNIENEKNKKTLNLLTIFFKTLIDWYITLTVRNRVDIPDSFDRELDGIVSGCHIANKHSIVAKPSLWSLNVGFESLMAVAYTGKALGINVMKSKTEIEETHQNEMNEIKKEYASMVNQIQGVKLSGEEVEKSFIKTLNENIKIPIACNGFSVFGDACEGNNHFYGRDFQFSPAGVFQDTACMVIHKPRTSDYLFDSLPFVSVTAPGMIGSISCMNSRGIASGMNMVPAANSNSSRPGFNTLLLNRYAIEHGASAKSAIRIFEKAQRGVSWAYVIGDGYYDEACVVEAGEATNEKGLDFLSYPDPDLIQKNLLPDLSFINQFKTEREQNGLMIRWSDYKYPYEYVNRFNKNLFQNSNKSIKPKAFEKDGFINDFIKDKKKPESNCPGANYFAPLRKDNPQLIFCSNQYMIPEMRLCSMNPQTNSLVKSELMDDIQWRYDALNSLFLKALENGRKINYDDAKRIINFLSPTGGEFPEYYLDREALKRDGKIMVNGTCSIFDLKKITVETQYGYYGDGFVKISLKNYL